MKGKFFLDTNIFVYSFDVDAPVKKEIATDLVAQSFAADSGVISYQIIQEFLNVASRKFKIPLSKNSLSQYLTKFMDPLCKVYPSINLYIEALDIHDRWRFSFYDSLVISSALQAQCEIIYSEDLQHDQVIKNTRIINPFL
ncbi:MAG: PIN domain-containing protein [Bacteroidota bacterium]